MRRLLIANRGEIALRVVRACRALGIQTVAVHSEADRHQMHLRFADQTVCIGPAPAVDSYLNIPAIISAMEVSGADAVHPGYGFLAESPDFAAKVEASGYCFVGPKSDTIASMGDKITARQLVQQHGMPVVPGSKGALSSPEEGIKLAEEIGYPVILKASAGGGGRGTSVVWKSEELAEAYATASSEAKKNFGDATLYLEKFLQKPRHIEVQVACDGKNAVHFGDRDCSVQRRRQKLIEEGPATNIDVVAQEEIRRTCVALCEAMEYRGVGTIELLYEDGHFYFIEMNTRIQVEHCVSEMITGHDLITLQLQIASKGELGLRQSDITIRGHALECRINAEHPDTFAPSPGESRFCALPFRALGAF